MYSSIGETHVKKKKNKMQPYFFISELSPTSSMSLSQLVSSLEDTT